MILKEQPCYRVCWPHSKEDGGDAMKMRKHKKHKIHISLMELLTFGIFLLALLTFVFTFCR